MIKFGPALLITAAFIGPGTVTTASVAGANFGFTLVWALLFSVIATMVLQEMAARLGVVTQRGLAEALSANFNSPLLKKTAILLVISAIGVGNAAYEAGNLTGASLGLSNLMGGDTKIWSLLLAVITAILLKTGQYKLVERSLIALVLMMSVVFLLTMFLAKPDLSQLLQGAFKPSLPDASTITVIALIGTTVVPYNLFLHASLVKQHWSRENDVEKAIGQCRWDTGLSVSLGGIVTLAVISTAAVSFYGSGQSVTASNMAQQLEPLLGSYASTFFAIGLFSAGLTSSITAPLAASYAVCGALGWSTDLKDKRFQGVWLVVLLTGVIFACVDIKPIAIILLAQTANGLLLPVIACFLLWVMNNKELLGKNTNGVFANAMGVCVVLVVSALGMYKLVSLF